MNGKTKIVAAVAAGAVALTIGAGAARCAMDAPDAQNGQQAPQEQAQGKQDDAKASQSSQQAPDERLLSESEFSSLANTSWTSRDGASKLSIAKDALIVASASEHRSLPPAQSQGRARHARFPRSRVRVPAGPRVSGLHEPLAAAVRAGGGGSLRGARCFLGQSACNNMI